MNSSQKEIIRLLISQTEATLAALKKMLEVEDNISTATAKHSNISVSPVTSTETTASVSTVQDVQLTAASTSSVSSTPKKKMKRVLSKEDVYSALGLVKPESAATVQVAEKVATVTPTKISLHKNSIDVSGSLEDSGLPDDEELLGRRILKTLKLENSKCSVLRLQKRYYDNGSEKLYIDRWHVNVTLLDQDMKVISEKTVTWKALGDYHYQLRRRGLERHSVSDDPHSNWMPNVVNLDLG